jgi:sigma-70, region 4
MKAYHNRSVNKEGEYPMDVIIAERALEKFKRDARATLREYEVEDRYSLLEPYFEEAMNKLPEERKEMFYMRFGYQLNDLEIAIKLDMSILDVMKELRKSIFIALIDAEELFLKDHGELIDEMI